MAKAHKPNGAVPGRTPKKISETFQRWLLICVAVAFLATTVFLWILQTGISENNAVSLLRLNITDVRQDINDASDRNLLSLTHSIADELANVSDKDSAILAQLAQEYGVAEINRVAKDGTITASTNDEFIGYDMSSGKQAAAFMVLTDGTTEEYVQSYRPISYDESISRKYAGVAMEGGGFVQVGYDAERFQEDIDTQVVGVTRNRHVGEGGCIIISNEHRKIVSDPHGDEGEDLSVTGIRIDTATMPEGERFTAQVYGEECYCMYVVSEGYYIIAVMPQDEAVLSRNVSVLVTTVMEIIVFAALFVLIYYLIKKLIVNNIQSINGSLAKITEGDLNVSVDVRSNAEFASLSDDINSTVDTLKRYIAEADARIDAELMFAKAIQHSALPSVFPPYPNRTDFEIYALMDTAKEVGGDFYDFYFLNDEQLAFLIADVSGKGIGAAMFMMTAKTMIKSFAETGLPVEEAFTRANEKLCENNSAGMFVTAWMGVLNVATGCVTFANAGHNPPLVRHGDGSFEYLRSRAGLMLAGMDGIRYRSSELQLAPGDVIYLYTDGVTEAMNADEKLYGDARLQAAANAAVGCGMQELCVRIKADVDGYVGAAPQFDDITMLALKYNGR